ncbi:hypothetical protein BLS_001225 [Venturia inaequalis]|uniref:Uncharacterized protein n=1 Tax=Venturia inaequalis TaxID=5025 RepID=A0A8H3YRE1_VENIN|nr:hypothetical protein BLS_001225 [Venturia inaequalis]KAE9966761.1 hypothetical protein EG328_008635 [Venturia inaequalis]RDI77871.1 hypothetical protein Vi05172_g12074 [Venturia inaequalis]
MSAPNSIKDAASLLQTFENRDEEAQASVNASGARTLKTQHEEHQGSLVAAAPETSAIAETFSKPQTPSGAETQPEAPVSNIGPQHLVNFPDRPSSQRPYSLAVGLEDFSHVLKYNTIPDGGFEEKLTKSSGDGALHSTSVVDFASREREVTPRQKKIEPETPLITAGSLRPETSSKLETLPTSATISIPAATIRIGTTTRPAIIIRPETPPRLQLFSSFKSSLKPDTLSVTHKSLLETAYPTNEALVYDLELGDLDACIDKVRTETEKRGGGRQADKELEVAIEQLKFLERQILALELIGKTKHLRLSDHVHTVEEFNTTGLTAARGEREKPGILSGLLRWFSAMNMGRRQKVGAWGKTFARIKERMRGD